MAVDRDLAKQHLRVDDDAQNALIEVYLSAAKAWVSTYIDKPLADIEGEAFDLDAAVLLLTGDFFVNRESGTATPAVTAAVHALCSPYRAVLV